MRSFLGFANYHRRFVKDFAKIANPLTQLTRQGRPFEWDEKCQTSFQTLRDSLSTNPVLSHPIPDAPFVLDTDASAFALGGVLSQQFGDTEKVVAYASQTMTKSQKNYCTTHRELLAVVQMTQHFKHYLWGRRFLLRTDHASIRWLLNYKDADGMLARWLAKLAQYDFVIEHRPGKQHCNADGLSRCHACSKKSCPKNEYAPLTTDFPKGNQEPRPAPPGLNTLLASATLDPLPDPPGLDTLLAPATLDPLPARTSVREKINVFNLEKSMTHLSWLQDFSSADIASAQKIDPNIGPIYRWIESDTTPTPDQLSLASAETKALSYRMSQMALRNTVLTRTPPPSRTGEVYPQIILPRTLRELVLHQLHDLRVVGHLGIQRTIARVQARFYWPGLSLDVSRWCQACPKCSARKGKPGSSRIPLTQRPVGSPFDRIAVDILDSRRKTPGGYQYILVISDYFTKYTDAFAIRRHTAPVVADILARRWICYAGVPRYLHSDQGKEFESALIARLTKLLGCTKTRTAPYRPQSDGQVERANRTILGMLSAFTSDNPNNWDKHLPYVMMAYRSSRHETTGCTPFCMVYGRECNLPADIMFPDIKNPVPQCGPEYVEFIRRALDSAHEFARNHLKHAAIRQKRNYDRRAMERPQFKVGDLVRYYYPPARVGNKFALPWFGPYEVIGTPTPVDYTIKRLADPSKTRTVHMDALKPYHEPYTAQTPDYPDENDDFVEEDVGDDPVIDKPVTPEDPEPLPDIHPPVPDNVPRHSSRPSRPPKRLGFDDSPTRDRLPKEGCRPHNRHRSPKKNRSKKTKSPKTGRPRRDRRRPARLDDFITRTLDYCFRLDASWRQDHGRPPD